MEDVPSGLMMGQGATRALSKAQPPGRNVAAWGFRKAVIERLVADGLTSKGTMNFDVVRYRGCNKRLFYDENIEQCRCRIVYGENKLTRTVLSAGGFMPCPHNIDYKGMAGGRCGALSAVELVELGGTGVAEQDRHDALPFTPF